MTLNRRRIKILDLIREDGHAKVHELSKIFKVTDVTIRQDLEILEDMGYIQREHGGAFLKEIDSFAKSGQVFNQTHIEEKRGIARKAVTFINEGDSIILDSGSTTTEIAKLLTHFKELTVITNALNIALILGENHGINLIVTGGEFKAPTLSLTGKMAADAFKDVHVNKLFLATAGISSDMRLTYPSLSDLIVKTAMIKSADKVYLVADSSKIGISAFANLGFISLVDAIITDANISDERLKNIREQNVDIYYSDVLYEQKLP
ncbi:MAG: DeoR/GlpR family DNA-binding transcription regulator [Prevotellaceae bacterium]|jgi:DeoR/GlpR family transcriptional regulator of sugar metabolism|nr:DeoR/GlpR family DNA-binding transcription regulator [Prevotellaceae bacterium]